MARNDIERQAEAPHAVRDEIVVINRRTSVALADVSRKDDVTAMAKQAIADLGALDAVVINAGISIANSVEDSLEPEWDAVLDVDAQGLSSSCRRFCVRHRAISLNVDGGIVFS